MGRILHDFCNQYIRSTAKEALVLDKRILLCHLTHAVINGCGFADSGGVYMRSRAMKHIYDKKPAEEFDFIVDNLETIVRYPNQIYKNKNAKRGDLCFVKRIDDHAYLCSLEIRDAVKTELEVATAFRIRKEGYLKQYNLLWSWRDDAPSS